MGTDAKLEQHVERLLGQLGQHIVLGLPLGLGKPNRFVNALYERARADRDIRLDIVTALSLDVPQSRHWLQERLMGPIVERHFGADYPRLQYLVDLNEDRLPTNIKVTEFYFKSGAALGKPVMQRHYISSNYTHVARDLLDRGVNLVAQLVAGPEDGRYSLSSNADVTLDLKRQASSREHPIVTVGHLHPDLPFMHGDAIVDADFFDLLIDEDPVQPLFGLPRLPVALHDHAVGLHASRLIADGGTLQIGIGSLSDALVHGLILRHQENERYREAISAFDHERVSIEENGRLDEGLHGASEMFLDGFMHLYKAGVLSREVFDDLELQRRANAGEQLDQAGQGALMDGGFFLGSLEFYDFLRNLDDKERPRFRMHGVGRINQLYGGNELLEIAQRRHARFVNTCMMMTATGAAVSDGLKDHQVVSGVGGQYNFVAMAQAMDDGRSVLMLRAARGQGKQRVSNIVWEYPHTTIPRHLRDLVVTEYGIAELRGKTDEECIKAMVGIMEAPFQETLVEQAKSAGKLDRDWRIPDAARKNTPEDLKKRLAPFSDDFPSYPFGSDFTEIEQQLIPALSRLKRLAASKPKMLMALLRGRPAEHREALARLGLDKPDNLKEKAYARLIASVL